MEKKAIETWDTERIKAPDRQEQANRSEWGLQARLTLWPRQAVSPAWPGPARSGSRTGLPSRLLRESFAVFSKDEWEAG